MPKALGPDDQKIPHTVALTPRQARYALDKARWMQISVPDYIRRLLDREIERDERQRPLKQLDLRA
jgi:hypothetical protein